MEKKVNVLGTEYTINYYDFKDKPIFEKRQIDGYHDGIEKEIAIVRLNTYPGFEDETEEYCRLAEKDVLRHEIVHAFLFQCGLADNSMQYGGGWAKNEEMVDWIALMFPKMQKAFQEAGCI